MMLTLNEKIIQLCENISTQMEQECDGSYVGAEDKSVFEFDGKKYELILSAFWEKSRWYEYSVSGIGFVFNRSGSGH